MQTYKTIEEKAAEWNLSSRHIQYLCRNDKIDGAIKRAGAWFIPGDMCSPAKNTKSGQESFNFTGTKKKIFYSAIELFMLNGFDSVSIRDVANKAGIRQSTIYNHFKSKQEILDAIYEFYCHYYLEDRLSMEEMEVKLQNESLEHILQHIRYLFKDEYLEAMTDITKIIFQRIGVDPRAREIGKSLMVEEGVKYVEDVFNKAIEMGRVAPFDTNAMAVFINSSRIFTLYCWILDSSPAMMAKLEQDEQALYGYALRLIRDLKPPRQNG